MFPTKTSDVGMVDCVSIKLTMRRLCQDLLARLFCLVNPSLVPRPSCVYTYLGPFLPASAPEGSGNETKLTRLHFLPTKWQP